MDEGELHRCLCILLNPDNPGERDHCPGWVGPDQPMCDDCQEGGHDEYENQLPLSERPLFKRLNHK